MVAPVEKPVIYSHVDRGIRIDVEPAYVPERSIPTQLVYFYTYAITITNERPKACRLVKRHWVIKDGSGQEERVEGDGVVGDQPWIEPGESYRYVSFCPLQTPHGNMRGHYSMVTADKDQFSVRIPLFFLRPPQNLSSTWAEPSPNAEL